MAASACMWDTDTLANEAKQNPGVVEASIGWFERNPALYFELRLKRAAEDIRKDPTKLEAYDDAGVACDRLGNDAEAIKWMDRKELELKKLDANSPRVKDHLYRLYANRGTFYVHGWLKAGSPKERIAEVERSIADLEKAIKINPDAHFGREIVQVEVIRVAYLKVRDGDKAAKESWFAAFKRLGAEKVRKGLVGMVFMGNAWESPDVFAMIAGTCDRDAVVGYIAYLRQSELLASGRSFGFGEGFHNPLFLGMLYESRQKEIRAQFADLRKKADAYHEEREKFMLAKLKEGRHPDTDPTFWDGYIEPKMPELEENRGRTLLANPVNQTLAALVGIGALVVVSIVVVRVRRFATKKQTP
jgi:tetratricopeptide (TPR) repeat protein